MPRKRLSMRQVHEVLRLKWAVGLSDRQIAQSLGLSRPTVAAYVQRAQAAGLSWPLPAGLDAATLEQRLFPTSPATGPVPPLAPDWPTVRRIRVRNAAASAGWKLPIVEPGKNAMRRAPSGRSGSETGRV